jgi:small subunit ribosomal protein S14
VAKKSKLEKNKKIKRLILQHKQQRDELLNTIRDPEVPLDEKLEANRKLAKIPRNASPIRYRNRCNLTGRPRGYLRKFQMSRIAFRELSHEGQIPGVTKSSW